MATSRLFRPPAMVFLLAPLFVAGCGESKPLSAAKEAPRVSVVHPISRSLTDEADYNGWLEAFKTVDVRARVRGYITKVCFQDGDLVTEGKTPLFDIDDAPFKADLARTEAQVAALEAQEVAAKALAERNRKLVQTHAVSEQELQESEANAKSYGAQIMAKKAEADRIRLDLNYCKIIAPLTGKVGIANLVAGALVSAGGADPVLTTIVTVDPVYVDFNVDERAIQRYQLANLDRPGKEKPLRERHIVFNFGLDTEKGFPHQGELVYVDIDYAKGTGTTLVRGIAENKKNLLMPGSRARVRLPIGDKYAAMLVPDTAVCTDQKQKYLLVVGENKNAKRVNVELGRLLDDGMRVILKPELKADESIICEGMERARLNYPVEPVAESAEAVVSTGE
jgi:RND family efflux transporter MFP subunit